MGNNEVSPVATKTGLRRQTALATPVTPRLRHPRRRQLNKIRIARCFPVAFGPARSRTSSIPSGPELRRPSGRRPRCSGHRRPVATSRRWRSTTPATSTRSGSRRRIDAAAKRRATPRSCTRTRPTRAIDLVDADQDPDAAREQRLRVDRGRRRRARRHRLVRDAGAHRPRERRARRVPERRPGQRLRLVERLLHADAERPLACADQLQARRSWPANIRCGTRQCPDDHRNQCGGAEILQRRTARSATSSSSGSAARARR